MCEVDWMKEVEISAGNPCWDKLAVLHRDDRWPHLIYGIRAEMPEPRVYDLTMGWKIRNTPPPPPEVWVVWKQEGDKVRYFTTYLEPPVNLREGFSVSKCDAPVIW